MGHLRSPCGLPAAGAGEYSMGMTTENIRDILQRRPFEPVRVVLSSGESYEIRHPENAMLMRGALVVGYPVNGDLPERFAVCSLLHIAHIEPVGLSHA
jgi:hypothetical protein